MFTENELLTIQGAIELEESLIEFLEKNGIEHNYTDINRRNLISIQEKIGLSEPNRE